MRSMKSLSNGGEMFDLQRFKDAQAGGIHEKAMAELAGGRKQSHWMWFIFPQIEGLGFSPAASYYSIKSMGEARAYLADKLLGARLREACGILLDLRKSDPHALLGFPDDLKLRSSMTLFDYAAPGDIFGRVLDKYFAGQRDARSLEIIGQLAGRQP